MRNSNSPPPEYGQASAPGAATGAAGIGQLVRRMVDSRRQPVQAGGAPPAPSAAAPAAPAPGAQAPAATPPQATQQQGAQPMQQRPQQPLTGMAGLGQALARVAALRNRGGTQA